MEEEMKDIKIIELVVPDDERDADARRARGAESAEMGA